MWRERNPYSLLVGMQINMAIVEKYSTIQVIFTSVFIAALFIVSKNCNKPNCLLTDEWVLNYYSYLKKN